LPRAPLTGKCLRSSWATKSGKAGPPSLGSRAIAIRYIRTSIAPRNPSLTRLNEIEVTKIIAPGTAQTNGTT